MFNELGHFSGGFEWQVMARLSHLLVVGNEVSGTTTVIAAAARIRVLAAGGIGGVTGQAAHFLGDHGKATAVLAGARGLDSGVQRQ